MNFDGADIQAVAKTLLGDVLGLNFVIDPRVQGSVTLASAGPIPRKDVMSVFESVLRMSNVAVVRDRDIVRIVPLPEASGSGPVTIGAGQPGFGVSAISLRYTSAAAVARTAENFLSRPGAIRPDPSRNLVLVQGTLAERQAALDVIASFDVEWMRNQSVGVYPLKATTPETMITELERVFESSEGGQGEGLVRFQPISRMNAVMVVTRTQKLLDRATQWVRRLDRSDPTGTTVRIYHLNYGSAPKVAKILNDIFVAQRSGSSVADTPPSQIAPGVQASQSRLDSLGAGSLSRGTSSGTTSNSVTQSATGTSSSNRGNDMFAAAFSQFSGGKDAGNNASDGPSNGGNLPRGVFPNVRITADATDNSIMIYSNQEDYRAIETAIRGIDRPPLQVAIEATVAEVTLTDELQYGVESFLTSHDAGLRRDRGSVGLLPSPVSQTQSALASQTQSTIQSVVQSAFLERVLPGFNLLLGSEAQPRLILSALSTVTSVKVLSAPSLVVLDNQPALLEVGNEIPVSTGSATILSNSDTPVVNTIEMRNTGVILKVLPHVHSNGTIQMEVEQEISNVVNQGQQTLTPTIAQRRVHSTVAVTSGQTALLGGLISERAESDGSGIPGLHQIKYLGDLFGNKSHDKERSEIIIFIRPRLIRNGLDASDVAEEFRDRLESMHAARPLMYRPGG